MKAQGTHGKEHKNQVKLAFLFPGQGSQSIGMLSNLKTAWHSFAKAHDELSPLFLSSKGESISKIIDLDQSEQSERLLMRTDNAQPALGLIESSLFVALQTLGIQADVCVGHSYGELVALYAAGFYDVPTLAKLSKSRGEILQSVSEKTAGRMLAVRSDSDTVQAAIAGYQGFLELANLNSPKQTVIGGRPEAIEMFIGKAQGMGVQCIPLKTAAAFHTSLMKPAVQPWQDSLNSILSDIAATPASEVIANSSVKAYAANKGSVVENLANQVSSPVQWVKTIERLYADGVRIFLEVGPGKALGNMVKAILDGKSDIMILTLDPGADHKEPMKHIEDVQAEIAARLNPAEERPARKDSSSIAAAHPGPNLDLIKRYLEVSETVTIQMAKDLPVDQKQSALDQYLKSTEAVMQSFLRTQAGGQEHAAKDVAPLALFGVDSPAIAKPTPKTWLKEQLVKTTGFSAHKIDEKKPFDSFGIDSITLMESLAALIETFPYLASKKAQLYSIRCLEDLEPYEEREEAPGVSPLNWLKDKLAKVTGHSTSKIDEDKAFDSFGIDSITMMECLGEMMEVFPALKEHKTALYSLKNLNDLKVFSGNDAPAHPKAEKSRDEAPKKRSGRKKSSRFSPVVNRIIARLVASFASTVHRRPEEFELHANLERDLAIDAFTRAEAIEDVLRAYPRFALAGQALMNVSSLGELGALLDRFDDLRSISLAPNIAEAARSGSKGVERFVLRSRREPSSGNPSSIQIPEDILLVGHAGPLLQNLKATFEQQGSEVQTLGFDKGEWSLELHKEKAPRYKPESLAEILKNGGHDEAMRFVIFLIEADDRVLLTGDSNAWQDQLDRGPVALFEFMKAMRLAHLVHRGDSLSLIGLEAGNVAWHATRGTLKSIARENSQLNCTSLRLDFSESRISRRKILETLITHQGQHEIYLSSSHLTLKVLEFDKANSERRIPLPKNALVLVSGGASGITATLAEEIARQYSGVRIAALGRSPHPSTTDDGEKAKAFREIERNIRESGSEFLYISCDIRDEQALGSSIDQLIQKHGPIHGYIHGSGVSEDSLLIRKSFESFKNVLETKTLALPILFRKLKNQPLAFVVLMSSLSALNGTPGQTDYSAANETLNAISELWGTQLNCPVISMLWSVWGETGLAGNDLVSRMQEVGLDPIATQDGIKNFIAELGQPRPESWVLFTPFSTLYYALEIEKEHFTLPEGPA